MAVFYRGPHAVITDEVFAVDETCRRRYAIYELEQVQIVREGRPDGAGGSWPLTVSGLLAVVATIPVAGRWAVLVASFVAAAAVVHLMARARKSRDVRWNLMAIHRGRMRIIFTSNDQREFEQVCRALQRSLERRTLL